MIDVRLIGKSGDLEITSDQYFISGKRPEFIANHTILATTDYIGAHGHFKTVTRTTAGTSQLVTPQGGGALILTDLLISGEKQAGSSAIVRFDDDTNSEDIFNASQVDAPPQIAIAFRGRFQGWRDARIDVETTGAGDATVTVGYVRVLDGDEYAEWDALRG